MADALHAAALRLLTGRALSERELSDRLLRRGFSPAAVRAEVERLRQAGLVDDLEVARATCARGLRRGYGRQRLAALLARRGVGEEAARRALTEISDEEEEGALARALGRLGRRPAGSETLSPEPRRVVRYLLARGFPPSLASRAGGKSSHGQGNHSTPDD